MSGLVAGDIAVVAIALLLAVFELWLGRTTHSRERLWVGVVCLATAAFAYMVAAQSWSTPEEAVRLQQLQFVAVGIISLAVLEFGAIRRGRTNPWPRRLAHAVMAIFFVPLVATHWVVSTEVEWLTLSTIEHPVPAALIAEPLGTIFMLFCLSLATFGAWDTMRSERRSWLLGLGLGVWLAASLRDRLNAVENLGQKQLVTAGTLADTDVVGYGLYLVSIVLFFVALFTEMKAWMVTVIIGSMVVGSIVLAPAIVFGYGIKSAIRDDREHGRPLA